MTDTPLVFSNLNDFKKLFYAKVAGLLTGWYITEIIKDIKACTKWTECDNVSIFPLWGIIAFTRRLSVPFCSILYISVFLSSLITETVSFFLKGEDTLSGCVNISKQKKYYSHGTACCAKDTLKARIVAIWRPVPQVLVGLRCQTKQTERKL